MITNNDCILLLAELNDDKANEFITNIAGKQQVSLEALKYINSKKPLEIVNFYEHIRKNYNKKKSTIYINIVKEIEDPKEVLTTLSALQTQIILYANKLEENRTLFLKHSRALEISKVLGNYFNSYDITKAISLLKLIKADILALEYVNGRREEK